MTAPATFTDAWHAWLRYRACGQRPLRLSTLADYESIYRCHLGPHLGEVPLADIDGTTIAGLVVALSAEGVRPKRLANVLVPLRACLRWHHRMGAFGRDPTAWFDAPAAPADERRILTIGQLERLIAALPAFYRPLVTFAAYTGVRLGELRALTWADVDLETRTARIDKTLYRDRLQRSTKTGYDRTVPIPAHVAEVLRAWREVCPSSADGPLFPGPSGVPLDADTFRATVWRPAVRSAGLPETLRIHDLRHTSASLYLQHGATVREVMDIHGWRQMQTAMRYLHTGEELNAAADRLSVARDVALTPSSCVRSTTLTAPRS
ncbi:MAG: site-specific integrase [Coriobacteriia bacterium]|nr:site-specific integrase [Coriobacteriia bacterium]